MESYKSEFIEFMVEADVLKFGDFTLKSGRKSPFFMNAGAYVTGSQLMRLGEYYAKAIHDYLGDKGKAIAAKFEIAKFMGEIVKHNGDAKATVNDKNFQKRTALNLNDIRAALNDEDDSETYNLKKN